MSDIWERPRTPERNGYEDEAAWCEKIRAGEWDQIEIPFDDAELIETDIDQLVESCELLVGGMDDVAEIADVFTSRSFDVVR